MATARKGSEQYRRTRDHHERTRSRPAETTRLLRPRVARPTGYYVLRPAPGTDASESSTRLRIQGSAPSLGPEDRVSGRSPPLARARAARPARLDLEEAPSTAPLLAASKHYQGADAS